MPAIGGLKIPISPELLDKAKGLYLAGNGWAKVAELTGLKESSLTVIASVKGWTAIKAEAKAKAELAGLRPKIHSKLVEVVNKVQVPKSNAPSKLQPVANLLLTCTSAAEKVEGWAPSTGNTLVNVLAITQAMISSDPEPVTLDVASSEPVSQEQDAGQ